MQFLVIQISDDLKVDLLLAEVEGKLDLHLVQDLLNVDEGGLEVGAGLDQVFGQVLSGLAEGAVAHVALPGAKDFLDEVEFEELHS